MRVKSFSASNYKGFRSTAPVELGPGLNLIIGANNAGKTALIEALAHFPHGPRAHRNKARPQNLPLDPTSTCDICVTFTGHELKAWLLGQQFNIVLRNPEDDTAINQRLNRVFESASLDILLKHTLGSQNLWSYPDGRLSLFAASNLGPSSATLKGDLVSESFYSVGRAVGSQDSTASLLGSYITQNTYRFNAERVNISRCVVGDTPILANNAQNLAAVLQFLQHDHISFNDLNDHMRFIFSNVFRISPIPVSGNQVEIRVWFTEPVERRTDLAIPLSECGTGVGQVLAMLYVVVSSPNPLILIIDEPGSFLNPGATRRLIHVLRQYSQHQYVLATHSPEIIASPGVQSVHLVRWEGEQSSVVSTDRSTASSLQTILVELGVRLSDVFGADNIMWVEGPTERDCVTALLGANGIETGLGLNIVPLSTVGDLEGASSRVVWDLHRTISQQNALVPRTLAYVLDREGRSESERAKMTRESHGLIRFLSRRMFENYFLDPEALAALINHLDGAEKSWIADEIETRCLAISEAAVVAGSMSDAQWLSDVHAANILKSLVNELTEARHEYRKVEHGVWLTKWFLANKPAALDELKSIYVEAAGQA